MATKPLQPIDTGRMLPPNYQEARDAFERMQQEEAQRLINSGQMPPASLPVVGYDQFGQQFGYAGAADEFNRFYNQNYRLASGMPATYEEYLAQQGDKMTTDIKPWQQGRYADMDAKTAYETYIRSPEAQPTPIGGYSPAPGVGGLGGLIPNNPFANLPPPPQFLPSPTIEPGAPAAGASQIDASIRPFLTEGLRQAQEIFLRQQPQMFPGQMYVSPSQQTLEALQAQENIARTGSPILGEAQSAFLRGLTAPSAATPLYQSIFGAAGTQPGADVYRQAAQGGMPIAGQAQLQNLYGAAGMQPGQDVFGAAAGGQFQNIATGQLANIAGGGFLQGSPYQQAMMEAATRPLVQQFGQQVLPGISSLYSKSGRLGSGAMERALGTATEQYGRALGDVTANLAGTQYQQERALQQQALGQLAGVSAQDIQTRLAGAGALEQAQRAAIGQQAGIAGQLAGLSAQDIQTRLAGAQGLQQAQQAALGTQLQAAGGVGTGQYQELTRQLGAAQAAPQIYGQQFLPSQTLAEVGAQREAIAAQPLQEQMARFGFQQRLPYEQLSGYLSSVYGSPLGSYGTPAPQPQYAGNRTAGILGGALLGGMGGYLANQIPGVTNFFGGSYGAPIAGGVLGGIAGGFL